MGDNCGVYENDSSVDTALLLDDGEGKGEVTNEAAALKDILDFAVNNQDLDRLLTIIDEFNPIKILGSADFEIRHSNVLKWLISPDAHHGLNDLLFKSILLEVLKNNQSGEAPKIADVLCADYGDLHVRREWKRIDVFAVSPANKLVVAIENKIGASESEHQLTEYAKIVDEYYPNYKKVFIYLTLYGDAPKGSDRYFNFSHEQIHNIVSSAVEPRRDYLHPKVYDFIHQYLEVLGEKIMPSNELVEICSKLYQEHGDAIQKIIAYGKPKLESKRLAEFHERTKTICSGSTNLKRWFIPEDWENTVPKTSTWANAKYLVVFELNFSEYENHRISLFLYVHGFSDADEHKRFRLKLSEAATDKNVKQLQRRLSLSQKAVLSIPILLQDENGDLDLDDYDAVIDTMVKAYNSPDVQKTLKIVDGVIKEFWGKNVK